MNDVGSEESHGSGHQVSRRRFLKTSKNVAAGAAAISGILWLEDAVAAIPVSEGYLLVDTKKCQGCAC